MASPNETETLQQIALLLAEIPALMIAISEARVRERRLVNRRNEEGVPPAFAELSDWWEWRGRRDELNREIEEARRIICEGEERLRAIGERLHNLGIPLSTWFRSGKFGVRLEPRPICDQGVAIRVKPWPEATAGICIYPDEIPF